MADNEVGKLCSELSGFAAAVRKAKALLVDLPKVPSLLAIRQNGKIFCGAHTVLTSVAVEALPTEVEKFPEYVAGLEKYDSKVSATASV